MNVDRLVHVFAGVVILLSLVLSIYVNMNWLWLNAFVGLNLGQSGLTNFCPLAWTLKKAGVPEGSCCS